MIEGYGALQLADPHASIKQLDALLTKYDLKIDAGREVLHDTRPDGLSRGARSRAPRPPPPSTALHSLDNIPPDKSDSPTSNYCPGETHDMILTL